MIQKGQNFRIFTKDPVTQKYRCVGMATNCTITLNSNTESSATKDDVSLADKQTVVGKNWQVQVDSLNVTDAQEVLANIDRMEPFTLMWDNTSTVDNQTPLDGDIARIGQAYLSDVSFTFDDRTNSSKSLQFSGTGPLESVSQLPEYAPVAEGAYIKGEKIRLFLGSDNTAVPARVIAAAKNLSLHISLSLEQSTTKDTEGNWVAQTPVGLSYDISTTALMKGDDVITSTVEGQSLADIMDIYEASEPVRFQIAKTSGANNRTKDEVIIEGSVIINSLTLNGPNRQDADYSAAFVGYGPYIIPSES